MLNVFKCKNLLNPEICQLFERLILTNVFSGESREMKNISSKWYKNLEQKTSRAQRDILRSTRPSSASRESGFPAALFPWLLWSHRFLQRASCHGNAHQSIVLLVGRVRGKMTLEQTSAFIYLLCETKEMKDALKVFLGAAESWQEKWILACGAPGGWSDGILPRMCVQRCSVLTSGRHMWF